MLTRHNRSDSFGTPTNFRFVYTTKPRFVLKHQLDVFVWKFRTFALYSGLIFISRDICEDFCCCARQFLCEYPLIFKQKLTQHSDKKTGNMRLIKVKPLYLAKSSLHFGVNFFEDSISSSLALFGCFERGITCRQLCLFRTL